MAFKLKKGSVCICTLILFCVSASVLFGDGLVEFVQGQGGDDAHCQADHVGGGRARSQGEALEGDDHQGGGDDNADNGVEGEVIEVGEQGVDGLGQAQNGDQGADAAGARTPRSRLPMPSTRGVYSPRGMSRVEKLMPGAMMTGRCRTRRTGTSQSWAGW